MALEDVRRKVLVTGGGGFIGSHLVDALLDRGCRVKVCDVARRRLARVKSRNLEFVGLGTSEMVGGMADPRIVARAMKDVDVVYHLALNWNGATWKHRHPLTDRLVVNIRGAINLLEAARATRVKHFLVASSTAAYGEVEAPTLHEETVCHPERLTGEPGPEYSILKLTTEKLCLMYGHRNHLPVTAMRIDYVLRNGERPTGSMVAVEDVVQAFLVATLNKRAYQQVFNVAGDRGDVSIRKSRSVLKWEPRRTQALT